MDISVSAPLCVIPPSSRDTFALAIRQRNEYVEWCTQYMPVSNNRRQLQRFYCINCIEIKYHLLIFEFLIFNCTYVCIHIFMHTYDKIAKDLVNIGEQLANDRKS